MPVQLVNWNEPLAHICRHGAVTIGNFDGVHLGHQALLAELRDQARLINGPAVVLTFDPHPLQLLRPDQFQPTLTTVTDRAELLQAHGADQVVILRTTPSVLGLPAQDFFDQMLRGQLAARTIVPGFNFAFGHNREGTLDKLREMCQRAAIGFLLVPPLEWNGKPISSSRVRNALCAGDVREAATLLGRSYRLRGKVGYVQRRGQALGFPTANLEQIETLVPAEGVYAVRVSFENQVRAGAANLGPNPTFGEATRKIEVHVIGFQGDLYGQSLAMDFVARLRETRRFAGASELVEQLRSDIEQARRLVSESIPSPKR